MINSVSKYLEFAFIHITDDFFIFYKQIARKRHKVIGTFRSSPGHTRPPASLKHIHLMPLSQIKKVLDIRETEGMTIIQVSG